MFKLNPNPTFKAPVSIYVPGEGMGRLTVEFKYLDVEARKAYGESLPGKTNLEALAEIVVGWSDIDSPYSVENLEKMLNTYDTAVDGFFKGFWDEITGAAAKN